MRVLTIHSGGLDSTTLLWHLRAEGHDVRALSVDYGQRHRRELEAAAEVCRLGGFPRAVADLSTLRPLLGGSSQTDDSVPVPEGHYALETMRKTVVPNRNMIMLAVALGHAVATGCDAVAYGAHRGDSAQYPDCRPAFASAMATAALLCDFREVELLRPFVAWTKADVVRRADQLGVPVGVTWSCYAGRGEHCARCGTCYERRWAFLEAGVPDPTEYEAEGLAKYPDSVVAAG